MEDNIKFKEFLLKISPTIKGSKILIPFPQLNFEARKQRRLAFRNENVLFKRTSSLSGEKIISFFHKNSPFIVYSNEEWWSDKWDPMDYGKDFDFSRPFFDQFYEFLLKIPRFALLNNNPENSPYCNYADGNKNCYLSTTINWSEDCYYGFFIVSCKNVVDCLLCVDSEILYECCNCIKSYNLYFSNHCNNCAESAFLYDCIGVKNSIFCAGLRNSQYCVFNEQYTKEEFEKIFHYYFSGSYKNLEKGKAKFKEFIENKKDLRKEFFINSENVSGNNIWNSQNILQGYNIFDSEDCFYSHDGLRGKDCADVCFFDGAELCYESTSLSGYMCGFSGSCRNSSNLFYCDTCYSCKDCFGCVGLKNKQYCIFNKQYKKEEYEDLLLRIISKMNETKEWGEFFPIKYSFFPYNNTLAREYFPMTKEEIKKNGWQWQEEKDEDFSSQDVLTKIPNSIGEISDDFCNEVLKCELTGKNYKIVLPELKFYKRFGLPIPRKSPQQRLKERLNSA